MRTCVDYSEITLTTVLLFIWQLPQHLVALMIYFFIRSDLSEWKNDSTGMTVLQIKVGTSFCWSLGQFIFMNPYASHNVYCHETGHSVQSLYLGPLYLLAVGIPSVMLFITAQFKKRILKHKPEDVFKWYHSHYPEKWADKLGGVSL